MSKLSEIKWKYLFSGSYIRVCHESEIHIGKNVKINNSRIIITEGSSISIDNDTTISNAIITITNGEVVINNKTLIGEVGKQTLINIEKGKLYIGHHTKIAARRIWIRFGGVLNVGNYTNINSGSEIRCDDYISVGNYTGISYQVNIWDTNTHNIYPSEQRKVIAEKYYPYFGKEIERPKTKPIIIGDFCWIGERSSILKGTTLGNEVSVGYNTLIAGKTIDNGHIVVEKRELNVI